MSRREFIGPVVLLLAVAACASLQPPIPANTHVDADQTTTFRLIMRAISQQNYTVMESDAAGGFVTARADNFAESVVLTVTAIEGQDGTSVKITPRSSRSSAAATEAARALRNEIDRLARARN